MLGTSENHLGPSLNNMLDVQKLPRQTPEAQLALWRQHASTRTAQLFTYTVDHMYTQLRLTWSPTCCGFSGTWPVCVRGVCTCNFVRINLALHGHSFS
jgi:hypothetical protein